MPPVWRAKESQILTLAVFTVGLALGGTTTTLALWIVGSLFVWLPPVLVRAILLFLGVLLLLRDLRVLHFRLPQRKELIPETIFHSSVLSGAFRFAVQLGLGFVTKVTSGAAYLFLVALLLMSNSLSTAILAGVGFGLGRALLSFLRLAIKEREANDLALHEGFERLVPWTTASLTVALVGFGAT